MDICIRSEEILALDPFEGPLQLYCGEIDELNVLEQWQNGPILQGELHLLSPSEDQHCLVAVQLDAVPDQKKQAKSRDCDANSTGEQIVHWIPLHRLVWIYSDSDMLSLIREHGTVLGFLCPLGFHQLTPSFICEVQKIR